MDYEIEIEGESESIVSQFRASVACEVGTLRQNYFPSSNVKIDTIDTILSLEELSPFAKCVYYEPPRKEKNQEELKDIFIINILNDIRYVKDNFTDIRCRQVFFHKFKKNINAVWDFVSGNDFSENLVVALIDCVEKLKAENITEEQLDAIKDTIEAISKGNITEEKFDYYMSLLIENDIPLISLPANILDLYD